jgi:hypothetical protein
LALFTGGRIAARGLAGGRLLFTQQCRDGELDQ